MEFALFAVRQHIQSTDKNAMKSFTCLPIVLLLTLGCQSGGGQDEKPAAPLFSADSVPFPVYMTFGEFEPYLEQDNDTTYVLNFWASWCQPCIEEFPFFERLIQETENQSVKTILVSLDFPKDIQTKLIPFVRERQMESHVILLADSNYGAWMDQVKPKWKGDIPLTLIYKGDRREVKSGKMSGYEELKGLVDSFE